MNDPGEHPGTISTPAAAAGEAGIPAVSLTAENFAPYGKILAPLSGREPEADEADFSFTTAALPDDLTEGAMFANLLCKPRDFVVKKLERHRETPEMLAALEGESILCVAPPSADPAVCGADEIAAIRIKRGQAVLLGPGTWHWIPFPLFRQTSLFLLMFRYKTGDNDLEILDLRKEYPIGL